MTWSLTSLLVLTTTFVVACGGGNGSGPENERPPEKGALEEPTTASGEGVENVTATDRDLLGRVSAALRLQSDDPSILSSGHEYTYIPALAYADLAAAREQLGLPEDAGFPGPRKHGLLASFAARPLFRFSPMFWSEWSMGPLGEVFDSRQIAAAAGTNFALSGPLGDAVGPEAVVVLRTRQPFGEITSQLRGMGYAERSDGLFVGDDPLPEPNGGVRFASAYRGLPFPAVGAADGGVVVLGGSPRVVGVALREPEDEFTPVAELVARLPGVARVARGFGPRSCVVAVGLGEDAAPRQGELQVIVDGAARAEALLFGVELKQLASIDGEVRFAEPTVEAERAIAPFTSTDEFNATRLAIEDVNRPYECP